jgi:hypothetical protein
MRSFSRLKNLIIFLMGLTASVVVCPKFARAFSLSVNPEFGYLVHDYKNTQNELSPFRGYVYGLGVDVLSGEPRSPFRFLFSSFYNQGVLSNVAIATESQSASFVGAGVGIYYQGIKLRGGIVSSWESNNDAGVRMNLAGTGTYYSLSYDTLNAGPFKLEFGVRSLAQEFSSGNNSSLPATIKSDSYLFYFSMDFRLDMRVQNTPWTRKKN